MSDQNRIEGWLKKALEMEVKGRDFYIQAAEKSPETVIKDFFSNLAALELVHIETIKNIHGSMQNSVCWTPQGGLEPNTGQLGEIFSKLASASQTPESDIVKAIDTALQFETEAASFYTKEMANASCDGEKSFLKYLAAEERVHHQMLNDMKLYYTDPESWAEKMSHGHLDGA